MSVPTIVIESKTLSLANARLKVEIWEQVKSGVIIQKGEKVYDPDERIAYWNSRVNKYSRDLLRMGVESASTIEIIGQVLEHLKPFIPLIVDYIRKLLKI